MMTAPRRVSLTAAVVFDVDEPISLTDDEHSTIGTLSVRTVTVTFGKHPEVPWEPTRVALRGQASGPGTGAGPSVLYFWLPRDTHRLPAWLAPIIARGLREMERTLALTSSPP